MSLVRLWFALGLACAVGILPARAGDQRLASADATGPAVLVGEVHSYGFLDLDDPCAVRDADGNAMLTFAGIDANDRLVWAKGFASLDAWRAYAGNDPCLASDKTGQVGWALSGGKEDIFWQLQAILYLCPEYRNTIEVIESRPLVYDGNRKMWLTPGIQLTGADNRFDLAAATIFWNPAVSSAAGGVQPWDRFPPLVALAHELVHAYQRIAEDETTYSSALQVPAMAEENLIRHAFYRRVPGYRDLRPRPGNAGFYLGTMLQYLFDDVGWADWMLSYAPLLDVFVEQEVSSVKYQVSSAPSRASSPPDLPASSFTLQTSHPRLTRAAEFAGGAGTAAAPYQIATARQLVAIGADPNLLGKYFALVADIDLDPNLPGGRVFPRAVIAYDEDPYNGPRVAYTGHFYGNSHTIRRLTIDGAGMQYLGLFGRIGSTGRIYDLALEGVSVRATDHAGGLAGLSEGGLTNCSVTGSIRASERSSWLGGMVGINAGTLIDCRSDVTLAAGDHGLMLGLLVGMHRGGMVNCRAAGALTSGSESLYLGGLAGACRGGIIRDSRASGQIWGGDKSWALGALAGRVDSESVIVNCSANGAVSAGARSHDLGGLIGACFGAEIADCSATGAVAGGEQSHSLGGLLGSCLGITVSDCYAAGTVSGFRMLGGFAGRAQAGSSIARCHAAGRVLRGSSPWGRGGFAGRIDSPADVLVTGCFWDIEASQASAPRPEGPLRGRAGMGLTTAQMQDIRTFQAAGWDMAGDRADGTADLWLVPEGGRYPVLAALPAAPLRVGSDSYQPHTLKGTGISSDPYRIATAEDLGAMGRYSRSAWYRLAADIDLSGIVWSASPVAAFDGIFDGHGHRIRSLTLHGNSQDRVGLFGRIDRNGWVFDLGLEDVSIDVSDHSLRVGALAGENAGHILNCYVTAPMRGGAAGIAGANDCRSLGGLVGVNWLGTVSDCYTVADVRAAAGSAHVGGLVGYNYMGTIANCYTAGRIRGDDTESFGALAGRSSEHAATSRCYYLTTSAGGGPDRGAGTAVTAEQMRHQATFIDWDFLGTWTLCEGSGSPHLQWEGTGCDK